MIGGDSYIQVVRFLEDGVQLQSVNIYGATDVEDSPHYDDQMELFSQHRFKEMSLDRKVIEQGAERVYHPGD